MPVHMTELTRRHFLQVLGVSAGAVGATLSVGGCAPAGTSDAPTGAGASAGKEVKSFAFTNYIGSEEANKKFIEGLVSEYGKAHDIDIESVTYPFGSYNAPLLLQGRGGKANGPAQVSIADVATFAAAGFLEDLTSVAAKHDYTDAGLKGCSFDGKVYALPWTIDAIGMVANSELLEKAGVSMPKTISEFEAALAALKAIPGVVPYAAGTKEPALKDVIPWMWTYGATLITDGKVTIGDNASVEALKWYKSLVDRKFIALDVDRPGARVLFGRGTAGFYDDSVQAQAFAKALPGTGAAVAAKTVALSRPVLKSGDTPQALLHGFGIMVFKGDASTSATKFAEYATTDGGALEELLSNAGLPPATKGGLASPTVADDKYQSQWADLITKTASSDPFWAAAKFAAIEKELTDAVGAVLTGQADAKSALTSAGAAMQKLVSG